MTHSLRLSLFLSLMLAACVTPDDEYVCDCVLEPTSEEAMAMQGFTDAALFSQGRETRDDENDLVWYQFDPAIATPEMIAASPAATCGYYDQPVVSSRIVDDYRNEDTMKEPGSKYLIVICGPANS